MNVLPVSLGAPRNPTSPGATTRYGIPASSSRISQSLPGLELPSSSVVSGTPRSYDGPASRFARGAAKIALNKGRGVAQPGSAPALGAGGRGLNSPGPD